MQPCDKCVCQTLRCALCRILVFTKKKITLSQSRIQHFSQCIQQKFHVSSLSCEKHKIHAMSDFTPIYYLHLNPKKNHFRIAQ